MPRRLALCAAVLALASAASCAPATVPGLYLEAPDGTRTALYADRPEDATALSAGGRESTTLRFARPVSPAEGIDLAVGVRTDAVLELALLDDRDAVLASARFHPAPGIPQDYLLHLPPGRSASALTARLESGSAEIRSLALTAPRRGYASEPRPSRSASVSLGYRDGTGGAPVSVSVPGGPGDCLVVRPAHSGTVRVSGPLSFQAFVAAGTELAVPLAITGGERITASSESGILSALLVPAGDAPLTDLRAVLLAPPSPRPSDQPYRLWRWDLLPGTLVLDFADYATQDRYLKRLAFFAEKPGFRGRLAGDGEIAALHGWNAHDYPSWTLASFFGLAAKENFPLNAEERALFELLVEYGILARGPAGDIAEGRGALISISMESASWLRKTFLDHEASHALFFQDADYRTLSRSLWDAQPPGIREFWNLHFRWRSYDTSDEYLCVNELQAYLVQQGAQAAAGYLENTVFPQLARAYPGKAAFLESVRSAVLAAAASDAAALDSYLLGRWGLRAGSFGRLAPLP